VSTLWRAITGLSVSGHNQSERYQKR